MLEDQIIVWTIRLALAGYGLFVTGFVVAWNRQSWRRMAKWIWFASCLFFFAHLIAAFQFYHHWSHSHAVEDTAIRTAETIGWSFGNGILFSYLFALIWLIDAGWWLIVGDRYFKRNRFIAIAIHGYMAFIIFNGAIVFEGGVVRWASIVWLVMLIGAIGYRLISRGNKPTHT